MLFLRLRSIVADAFLQLKRPDQKFSVVLEEKISKSTLAANTAQMPMGRGKENSRGDRKNSSTEMKLRDSGYPEGETWEVGKNCPLERWMEM